MDQLLFALILIIGIGFFIYNLKKLIRNIRLGKSVDVSNEKSKRWKRLILLALGQRKMFFRPVSGVLHIIVYLGFFIINIEMLEILIDGLFGTHRFFSFWGNTYIILIACFEFLAVLVVLSVFIFWIRRNFLKISRLNSSELEGFPKKDANYILYFEAILMLLFLLMNAFDLQLQQVKGVQIYNFPISGFLSQYIITSNSQILFVLERLFWWLHIIGVLLFLNYLYYSKHLHILLAFPYAYFSDVSTKSKMNNMPLVTKEVRAMLFNEQVSDSQEIEKLGVSDATDLNWVQLLSAYTCTQCGRCSTQCPATQTGKLLSPRKVMIKTRHRIEQIGKNIDAHQTDEKQLLGDYISEEEIWACTSCGACVEACPIEISPMSIILEMRRYLVMEQSKIPMPIQSMFIQMENNGSPWPYNAYQRMDWTKEN